MIPHFFSKMPIFSNHSVQSVKFLKLKYEKEIVLSRYRTHQRNFSVLFENAFDMYFDAKCAKLVSEGEKTFHSFILLYRNDFEVYET